MKCNLYLEFKKSCQDLLKYGSYKLEGQWRKFVLFEEVVEVLFQHLKYQAGVVLVLETLKGSHKVVIICIFLAESCKDSNLRINVIKTNQYYSS